MISLLKREFSVKTVDRNHITVTSLPWKRIYTTNYDDVLEVAARSNNRLLTPVTLQDKPQDYKNKGALCIHLNGFVQRLTPDRLNREFKLTDVSYLTEDFKESEWVSLFRTDVNTSDAVVFIGFSLRHDLDLKRILYSENTQAKCYFIVHQEESEQNIRLLKKFGTPLPIGLDMFSEVVKKVKSNYIRPEVSVPQFMCFRELQSHSLLPQLQDSDAIKLFLDGEIKNELIEFSIYNPDQYFYFFQRDQLKEVIESVKKGQTNFLVHSDLGNGKTVFLHGVAYMLKSLGYKVYFFRKYYDTLDWEIEKICLQEGKSVIIVENYSNRFDVLEKIALHRTNDLILMTSERTMINDTVFLDLEQEIFYNRDYKTVNLNRLSDKEITDIISLLDRYGFWGDYAAWGIDKKKKLIVEDCQRTLRLLLLKILQSPNIKSKFKGLLLTIQNRKNFFSAITLVLASNVFGFQLSIEDLIYLLDDEILNNPSFHNNSDIKEIIDFGRREISVRSSILSEVLLTDLDSQLVLIDVLVDVMIRLDKRRFDRNNKDRMKSIMSFSRLQRILNKKEEYSYNIISFFERIKNLNFCRENPHFWLQYAIARLSISDYPIADTYFRNAYAFAERISGFDTYKIDNHFARHLIENEIYFGTPATCMDQFVKAHKILMSPSDKDRNKYYPFKVASKYQQFYDHYFNKLSPSNKVIFLKSCKEVLYKIDVYKKDVQEYSNRREVIECESHLTKILQSNASLLGE